MLLAIDHLKNAVLLVNVILAVGCFLWLLLLGLAMWNSDAKLAYRHAWWPERTLILIGVIAICWLNVAAIH
jgi:hypothetical protein